MKIMKPKSMHIDLFLSKDSTYFFLPITIVNNSITIVVQHLRYCYKMGPSAHAHPLNTIVIRAAIKKRALNTFLLS